jgi:hypothetical protein
MVRPALTIDNRSLRARTLVANILKMLDGYIPHACREDVFETLYKSFYEAGAEVITDADRQVAGLPPRNEHGLTAEELHAIENLNQPVGR